MLGFNSISEVSIAELPGAFVPVLIFCSIFTILGMSINVPPQHIELYNNNNMSKNNDNKTETTSDYFYNYFC